MVSAAVLPNQVTQSLSDFGRALAGLRLEAEMGTKWEGRNEGTILATGCAELHSEVLGLLNR